MTAEQAAAWRRLAVPSWVPRLALTALWAVAVVVGVASDDTVCTASEPCWPDPLGTVLFVPILATPVLLWWLPRLGCVWGGALAMWAVVGDDQLAVRAAFAVHALASVVVAVRFWRARAAQQQLVGAVAADALRPLPAVPVDPSGALHDPRRDWHLLRVGATALALLCATVLAGCYLHLDRADAQHRSRAVAVAADVVAVDEWDVTFAVPTALGASRQVVLEVWDPDDYPVGVRAPVRVDPTDEGWVELVAEPHDRTLWLGAAAVALLFAGLCGAQEWRRRWAVSSLWFGPLPAVDVLLVPDEVGDALVFGVDADPITSAPVARLPVAGLLPDGSPLAAPVGFVEGDDPEDDVEEEAAFARAWRGEDGRADASAPERATLLGAFHDGGWVALVTPAGTLVPAGPLRACTDTLPGAVRRRWRRKSAPGTAAPVGEDARASGTVDSGLPGVPVTPAAWEALPRLPLTVHVARRTRLQGLGLVVGAFVGVPAVLVLLGGGRLGLAIAALGGARDAVVRHPPDAHAAAAHDGCARGAHRVAVPFDRVGRAPRGQTRRRPAVVGLGRR
ncbi:hypothetical protein [Egicoccus sp. AB-alg2]|uniref:hypothetical protein n=1 Tax=Egicoccus sp. AB-alg2 TaxID=3242693 RepID=UPI00359E41FF